METNHRRPSRRTLGMLADGGAGWGGVDTHEGGRPRGEAGGGERSRAAAFHLSCSRTHEQTPIAPGGNTVGLKTSHPG